VTGQPGNAGPERPSGPGLRPLTVTGLLLLDPHGHDPTRVESITFDDAGIGVVRGRGQAPRVLPWDAVVAHAVEPWAGGVIPRWWVDPEAKQADRSGSGGGGTDGSVLTNVVAEGRSLPHVEAGAMISIQTRTGTYRFLRSGGNPTDLAGRVAELAMRHQGSAGVSTVTTVATGRQGRSVERSTWSRIRPWLVVLLILLIAMAVTAILLQSAGVIHLPFLGGSGSGSASTMPGA
jgi:hypothetical protein